MSYLSCKLSHVRLVTPEPPPVPYGDYSGTWTSHHVKFRVGNFEFEADSADIAVRGINCPCVVHVGPNGYTVKG